MIEMIEAYLSDSPTDHICLLDVCLLSGTLEQLRHGLDSIMSGLVISIYVLITLAPSLYLYLSVSVVVAMHERFLIGNSIGKLESNIPVILDWSTA